VIGLQNDVDAGILPGSVAADELRRCPAGTGQVGDERAAAAQMREIGGGAIGQEQLAFA
jgi:hypothetical protein